MHGRTHIVDVLGRLSGLGLGGRRGAALRQQHRACAALHVVRRKDRLQMRVWPTRELPQNLPGMLNWWMHALDLCWRTAADTGTKPHNNYTSLLLGVFC